MTEQMHPPRRSIQKAHRHAGDYGPPLKQSVSDTAISTCAAADAPVHPGVRLRAKHAVFRLCAAGVRVVQGGSASCQAFCGYHNDISGQVFTR